MVSKSIFAAYRQLGAKLLPEGLSDSESESSSGSESEAKSSASSVSKPGQKRKAPVPTVSKAKPTASSSQAAPAAQAPVLQPTYTVAAVATRQIPTVAPLSVLNRAHIDTFKLAIESLRRASDQTPREVFITEAVSDVLTLKLYSSNKIKKQKE